MFKSQLFNILLWLLVGKNGRQHCNLTVGPGRDEKGPDFV